MHALHDWPVNRMDHRISGCADSIAPDFSSAEYECCIRRVVAEVGVVAIVVVPVFEDVGHGVSDVSGEGGVI